MSGRRRIGVALVGGVLVTSAALRAAGAEMLNPALQAPSQAPATPQVADPAAMDEDTTERADDGAAVAPQPFAGSLGAGLAEVRRLTEAEDVDAALAVAERLLAPDPAARLRAWLERQSGGLSERALAWFDRSLVGPLRALGLDPGTSAERAEVHYARGIALRAAARAPEAREAFGLVRGLGGDARPDAVYELGHIALVAGEGWRSEIPELAPPGAQPPAGQAPAVPVPGAAAPGAQAPGAKAPDEPDPLQEARRAYLNALEAFVERLRIDWRDADTRANVELVRRRLRELDELEQQRKEQQQQQQDQQQQGDQQQQPQDKEQQDPKQEGEQQDPQQEGEQQQDPQEGESEQPEEQPEPEPGEQPEEEEEAPEPTPEPEEGQLTKEQLQRLQQLLEENRKLGEETLKALRQSSRGRTARDW